MKKQAQFTPLPGELGRGREGKAWGVGRDGKIPTRGSRADGRRCCEKLPAVDQTWLRRLRLARVTMVRPNTTIT
ncbi:MAG TPA: hypothetical protein VH113_13145, partial [Gemmatimonadales bacterium]|nr:hypothetical protein [Gemmatimonadales bacterium]